MQGYSFERRPFGYVQWNEPVTLNAICNDFNFMDRLESAEVQNQQKSKWLSNGEKLFQKNAGVKAVRLIHFDEWSEGTKDSEWLNKIANGGLVLSIMVPSSLLPAIPYESSVMKANHCTQTFVLCTDVWGSEQWSHHMIEEAAKSTDGDVKKDLKNGDK